MNWLKLNFQKKVSLKNNSIFFVLFFALGSWSFAESMPPLPENSLPEQIWSRYCLAKRESIEIPKPNYQNDEIKSAARKLALISPYSYYFYSGPLYAYGLKNGKELINPPAEFPDVPEVKNGKKNAHIFLTLLCGEFRDRPTLIQSKLKWVNRIHTLEIADMKTVQVNQEIWPQLTASSYNDYLKNSSAIFNAKKQNLESKNYSIKMGQYEEEYPVAPFSVCETKFIFKNYVKPKKFFNEYSDSITAYISQYKKFQSQCSKQDLDYFYNFRGDSNFKPNSPESNGMIWFANTITNSCIRKGNRFELKTSAQGKINDPDICHKYFKSPFEYRWSAARAGLAAWMMRDYKHDDAFSTESQSIQIVPHLDPKNKPFGFKVGISEHAKYAQMAELEQDSNGQYFKWDETDSMIMLSPEEVSEFYKQKEALKGSYEKLVEESKIVRYDFIQTWTDSQKEFWQRADFGFNEITGLGSAKVNRGLVYERLRDAVNRHTDWYSSGYDDGLGALREQAYSPFVASSYEMSASDGFTMPGVTVQSPADGCKHWMFIFKLHKSQWYSTLSIQQNLKVDFNKNWFDETTLGTNHLADSERALDRLGTALEGELDSILYLHNLNTSGIPTQKCGYQPSGLPVGYTE